MVWGSIIEPESVVGRFPSLVCSACKKRDSIIMGKFSMTKDGWGD